MASFDEMLLGVNSGTQTAVTPSIAPSVAPSVAPSIPPQGSPQLPQVQGDYSGIIPDMAPYGYQFSPTGPYGTTEALRDPSIMSAAEEAQLELELRKQNLSEWQIRQQIEMEKQNRMMQAQQWQQQFGFQKEQYNWQKEMDEANLEIAKSREQRAKIDQKIKEWETFANAIQALSGPKDFLKAGLIQTPGQLPTPEGWMKSIGVDPNRKAVDWVSEADMRQPGAQTVSQMTPEQRGKTQGMFEWRGQQLNSPNTAGYFSKAPTLSKRW